MKLDRLMFHNFSLYPFVVTVGFVRDQASVPPHMTDAAVMHVVFKGYIFAFIGCGRTKNWVVLCELRQNWF